MSDSFAPLWIVACQAPLSMGFPRQDYWTGLPFPSLGDLPDPGIEPTFLALAARFFTSEPQEKSLGKLFNFKYSLGRQKKRAAEDEMVR